MPLAHGYKKARPANRTGLSHSTFSTGTARQHSAAALLLTEEIESARDQANQKQPAHAGGFGAFHRTFCHGEVSLQTHVQPVGEQGKASLADTPLPVMPLVRSRALGRAGMSTRGRDCRALMECRKMTRLARIARFHKQRMLFFQLALPCRENSAAQPLQ